MQKVSSALTDLNDPTVWLELSTIDSSWAAIVGRLRADDEDGGAASVVDVSRNTAIAQARVRTRRHVRRESSIVSSDE
jgi:hypothetical protein